METKIGIIKEIDRLGRLVVPKEIRARYGLDDEVELVLTEEGILLRHPQYRLVMDEKCQSKYPAKL